MYMKTLGLLSRQSRNKNSSPGSPSPSYIARRTLKPKLVLDSGKGSPKPHDQRFYKVTGQLKDLTHPHTEILRMSEKKFLRTRRTPASAPASILSLDATVDPIQKQARRPPAEAGSNRPVILLAENRESARVVLKKALTASGYDVTVVERASEALSIGAGYDGHIDFLITDVAFPGINGGLLAHLFQRSHPETRVLFLSGSAEEVLICAGTLDQKIAVLEQPVALDVVAIKVSEMIETRQGIQQKR